MRRPGRPEPREAAYAFVGGLLLTALAGVLVMTGPSGTTARWWTGVGLGTLAVALFVLAIWGEG